MLKFTKILLQNTKNSSNLHTYMRLGYSTVTTAELKNTVLENEGINSDTKNNSVNKRAHRNNIVAAAFASLNTDKVKVTEISTPQTDNLVQSATTINELLSISGGNAISRRHALKVISILADWSVKGKVKLSDFESDPRYLQLCKILAKSSVKNTRNTTARSDDLSTVLTVTADDEAARLVANITVPQMVKVMTTLTQKKRRSMILLRAIAFNICRSTELLDLKQCSDVLYCMAVLNFPDENLLERVCIDASKGINDNLQKSSVLGSLVTSLGLLKYKDNDVLEASSQWILKHTDISRPQDVFALILSMAVLNFDPSNSDRLFEKLIPQLNMADAVRPAIWLDLIWSLTLLNRVTPALISTILSKDFISKIPVENGHDTSDRLKIINIDAAVEHLIPNYVGPRLEATSEIRNVDILRSREKEEMSTSVIECLRNLISNDNYLKLKVKTNMGFYIDGVCHFDEKCNPILPDNFSNSPNQRRIAILALSYFDMCKGNVGPTGINALAIKFLETTGYRVLTVPYTEYKLKDKLIDRVQYLESKLKSIVQ